VSCHRARELIHSFIDDELDTRQDDTIRRHLDECEACKVAYRNQLTLRSGLQGKSLYYVATSNLRRRLRASLRQSLKHTVAVLF